MVRGYYPFTGVPGHEFVGVVERADDAPEWVGKRVAGEINAVCGTCGACKAGRKSHCERRTVLGLIGRNGTFAERLSLPMANLHAIPDHVSDEAAVFTEPLAAALHVLDHVRPQDRVLVVGDGRLGNLLRARDRDDRVRSPRRDARAERAADPGGRKASRPSPRPTT